MKATIHCAIGGLYIIEGFHTGNDVLVGLGLAYTLLAVVELGKRKRVRNRLRRTSHTFRPEQTADGRAEDGQVAHGVESNPKR